MGTARLARGDRHRVMSVTSEIRIHGIAAGGAGVGRLPDGRVAFVHRTAPGETVRARIVDEKRRWVRAELVRVLERSPVRREAPCPHYRNCGGCTIEHLEYSAQLRAKGALVGDALRRIGGLGAADPEVVASPEEFRYRNRVSFTLLRLGGGRVVAGFHELNRPDRVVDITTACLLPEPAIVEAWGRLREVWGPDAMRLPSGRKLRLTLRASAAGKVTLLVEGGFARGRPDELLELVPGLVSVWHRTPAGAVELLAGAMFLDETWGDEALQLGATAFLQVNRSAAALLERHVLELAGDVRDRTVIDAYCGVGVHARRLARLGARVTGIELDPDAVRNAEQAGVAGTRFIAGRVEDELPRLLPADLVILNPPRAGLDAMLPAALLASRAARVVYVSCDPATLARDLSRLSDGYAIRSVAAFDLFPQTSHVETVVGMECVTT